MKTNYYRQYLKDLKSASIKAQVRVYKYRLHMIKKFKRQFPTLTINNVNGIQISAISPAGILKIFNYVEK